MTSFHFRKILVFLKKDILKITQRVIVWRSGKHGFRLHYQEQKLAIYVLFQNTAKLSIKSIIYDHRSPIGPPFCQGTWIKYRSPQNDVI